MHARHSVLRYMCDQHIIQSPRKKHIIQKQNDIVSITIENEQHVDQVSFSSSQLCKNIYVSQQNLSIQ